MSGMNGAMTDFNIWNRTLTKEELFDWSSCKKMLNGNIVSWNNITLNMMGDFDIIDLAIDEVCGHIESKNKIEAFENKKNFLDGKYFCNKIGELAVASNNQTLQQMLSEVQKLENYNDKESRVDPWFFRIISEWKVKA